MRKVESTACLYVDIRVPKGSNLICELELKDAIRSYTKRMGYTAKFLGVRADAEVAEYSHGMKVVRFEKGLPVRHFYLAAKLDDFGTRGILND